MKASLTRESLFSEDQQATQTKRIVEGKHENHHMKRKLTQQPVMQSMSRQTSRKVKRRPTRQALLLPI